MLAYMYVHNEPLESDMDYYFCHIDAFKARKIRLEWIKVRRGMNARARRLGFKNYAEWDA